MSSSINNDNHLAILNSDTLTREFTWLNQMIKTRIALHFGQESNYDSMEEIQSPRLTYDESYYAKFCKEHELNDMERVVLLLALAPHISPQILDVFFTRNETYGRGFTEFGGVKGHQHSGFLPTGETAAFIIAGTNLTKRIEVLRIFDPDHFLIERRILSIEKEKSSEPALSGTLNISKDFLSLFTFGTQYKPPFNSEFPAQKITTNLSWDDLIVEEFVRDELEELRNWIKYRSRVMDEWGLKKFLKRGYRSLFYGPPGTGKTMTVSLIGKSENREVYRVDLSKIVSKYIGETEKNLANIFDQAENKDWILFFDEADAIFGKRTSTNDSKDRYANQEIAYLLQRMEDFPGVLILATNLKSNMDEAFARRFQSMIYFPQPSATLRMKLWKNALKGFELEDAINMKEISKQYEVTGGTIINILSYCSYRAAERGSKVITKTDLIHGIKKEYRKQGKTI